MRSTFRKARSAYRNGKRHEESSHSDKKGVALDLLRRREGAIADGVPVTAKINRFRFEEAAADLITEYRVNKRRSLDELERRIEKHLTPFFGGRRMSSIRRLMSAPTSRIVNRQPKS